MATYLAVPVKRTWETDLIKPLKTFITNTFTGSDPEEYNKALQEFQKLRNSVISKASDKHESTLDVFFKYYDQLNANDSKFPITENQVRINFKWQDAFEKDGFFTGKKTLTISSSAYERVCILFNIAALQSQIAECQSPNSDEGLKCAAKHFQSSAGIFNYLKDITMSHVQSDPTRDLQQDSLAALSAFMLAQAQDSFCRKSILDKMKPAVVAKLCHQASDFYADAMKLLQISSIRDLWPKEWVASAAGKQAAYHALAEFYQSQCAAETKDFGEQIARLKHAKELMSAAEGRAGSNFIHKEQQKRITRSLDDANKDNEFIYHARVPELNTLPQIPKFAVAKVQPFDPCAMLSTDFKDIFESVVPIAVHQAMQNFESRKMGLVNIEIGRLREATQLLNGQLASFNLPAAIEDLSGSGKLPSSVQEKAQKIRDMGGISMLGKLMSDLPELLTRNREILDEAIRMLDEESQSDKQLREQFKERWTRTPSDTLTAPIRAEGTKYRTIIDNAIQADHIVQDRFRSNKEGIEMLSKSNDDIQKWLPSGGSSEAVQGLPVVAELKQQMEQVEAIKAEREVMESELKTAESDMRTKFMSALAADGAINEEDLSVAELDRIYAPLRAQVADSVHRQEQLVGKIQKSNEQFVKAKSSHQQGASREEKLKQLASAFDSFNELKNNLEEGTKFYNDLTNILVKYQSKVNDLCFARRTEKEDLMKELQRSIANQPAAASPATPAYHQPTESSTSAEVQNKKVPPPRPPPPTLPPAASTAPVPASAPPPAAAPPAAAPPPGAAPYGGYPGYPQPGYPQAPPSQAPYPAYGAATPYPPQPYPQQGYAPPPMPQGYNPYAPVMPYGQPGQPPAPYPQQQYPGYYPPQQ